MKGTTNETPLVEALRDLHFDRADGVLSLSADGRAVHLYLDQGSVFYAKSDAPEQRLDRILVRWGLVEEAAVAGLLQRAGGDVRGALVREGVFASEAGFDDFLGKVLVERALECFAWPAVTFSFESKDVRELHQLRFPLSTPNLILEGARRLPESERILQPLGRDPSPLAVNAQPAIPVESLHLSPQEGYVLSQVTGSAGADALFALSPLGADETLRLLYGLLVLDVLRHPAGAGYRFSLAHVSRRLSEDEKREAAERQAIQEEYRRIRSLDAFQLVPGAAEMTRDALRDTLRDYQEQWRSEKFSDRVAKDMREHLLLIAARAGEARLALQESERRRAGAAADEGGAGSEEDDFRLKRMEFSKTEAQAKEEAAQKAAEMHYHRALEAVKAKDYHAAIQFLQQAVRKHETARSHALLAECLSQNPHWTHKAEDAYRRAMELDQFDARLPLALGRLYARAGLKGRAREQYQKALEIQADLEDAKQALRELKRS